MKRIFFVFVFFSLLSLSRPAWAQAGEDQMRGDMQGGMMGGCQQMMPMCMPMMQQMMSRGMAMQEALHLMKDIVGMQERMLMNPSKEERKRMQQELSRMKERVDKMLTAMQEMPMMKGMPGMHPGQPEQKAEPGKSESGMTGGHQHH